jgi:hypothetical protein
VPTKDLAAVRAENERLQVCILLLLWRVLAPLRYFFTSTALNIIIVDLFPRSPPRLFPLLSLFLLLQNEIAELRTKLEDQRAEAALGARELEECRSEKVALRAHLEECIADKRAVEVKMAALYDRTDAEALVAMHNEDAATATASESMRDAMERNIRADLEVSSGAAHARAVDEAVTYVNHVELLPEYD